MPSTEHIEMVSTETQNAHTDTTVGLFRADQIPPLTKFITY